MRTWLTLAMVTAQSAGERRKRELNIMGRAFRVVAAVCAFLAGSAPAVAQSQRALAIPVPLAPLVGPQTVAPAGSGPSLEEVLAERLERDAHRGHSLAAPEQAAPVAVSPLRPLRARAVTQGSALRFDGERRRVELTTYVPEPARARALRVTTLSSINLLPERSRFRVFLNEVFIGEGPLDNFDTAGSVDLPLPEGVAQKGENRVTLELVHYHRVFCGPEASFSLWTDVDLVRSGIVLDLEEAPEARELFVLGLFAAGLEGGIELRGIERLGAEAEPVASALVTKLAGALGGELVPFWFGSAWTVAGAAQARARITFLPSVTPEIRFALGGDGVPVMLVGWPEIAESEALTAVMRELDAAIPPRRPAQPLPVVETGRFTTLAELGVASFEIEDRYSITEIPFRLPDDFVILTNAKTEMRISYAFVGGLPFGSVLQVYVNDKNIRVLPLWGEGQVVEDFPLRFEARHLRAGVNRIAFEVIIPGDPPDLPCPVGSGPSVGILDSTALLVPQSPSMFLPDMHFAFSRLGPDSVQVSALAARVFSSRAILALRAAFAGQDPAPMNESMRLKLLTLEELAAMPAGPYRFDRRVVERVLSPPAPDEPATAPLSLIALMQSQRRAAAEPGLFEKLVRFGREKLDAARYALIPSSGAVLDRWLATQSGKAILFQLDPTRPNEIFLVLAPGAEIEAIAAALVAARNTAHGPRGQVSVLDRDGTWRNWFAPDREPVLLEPLTLANLRPVVGNFVSAMPVRYVLGLFLLALLSAVLALRFVIGTRKYT